MSKSCLLSEASRSATKPSVSGATSSARCWHASFVGAARRGDKWFLDEVALTMNKRRYWLWRAVNQDGVVLDILVQS
jgi:transposase-like protein